MLDMCFKKVKNMPNTQEQQNCQSTEIIIQQVIKWLFISKMLEVS
jgi:hypothetical protein